METPREQRSPDPELLARLVLECRQLRRRISEVASLLPLRNEAPFLYRQIEEESELLEHTLDSLGYGERRERRRRSRNRGGVLSRLFRRAKDPRTEALDMLAGLDLQGRAWTIPISEVIGFLSTSGKTGILTVHSTRENFLIELHRGQLVHAKSDSTPEGMRLGEILCREGVLYQDEIGPSVDAARAAALPMGAYLLRTERVKEGELHDALSIQVQSMFNRLFTAENAIYRFREGARMDQVQDLGLNITQLLLESARFHDEKGFRAEEAVESVVGNALEAFGAQAHPGSAEEDADEDEEEIEAELAEEPADDLDLEDEEEDEEEFLDVDDADAAAREEDQEEEDPEEEERREVA